MQLPTTVGFNPLSLQAMPRKVVATLAAAASFAAIGVINTASFAIDKTADLIAWATNDRREESWAPFLMAIFIVATLARLLWMKLLQDQPANTKNMKFTPAQLEEAIKSFTCAQRPSTPAFFAAKELSAPKAMAFSSESKFAKNLKKAGENLFTKPAASPKPVSSSPPSNTSTRPPSPADSDEALLNTAFEELQAQPAFTKK